MLKTAMNCNNTIARIWDHMAMHGHMTMPYLWHVDLLEPLLEFLPLKISPDIEKD